MTSIVSTLDFLKTYEVGRLGREKATNAFDIHTGIVRVARIPWLAVLDVECEETEHLGTESVEQEVSLGRFDLEINIFSSAPGHMQV